MVTRRDVRAGQSSLSSGLLCPLLALCATLGSCQIWPSDSGGKLQADTPPVAADGGVDPPPSGSLPSGSIPWVIDEPSSVTPIAYPVDSGAPQVWTDHLTYAAQAPVAVSFYGLSGQAQDMIGIAPEGSAGVVLVNSYFTGGSPSGSHSFLGLPSGKYVARAFAYCTLCVVAESQPFQVGTISTPTIATDKASYVSGATVTVSYNGLPGNYHDWISFAYPGDPPTSHPVPQQDYTLGTVAGTKSFAGLPDGTYVARAYVNDSYQVIVESQPFTIAAAPPAVCGDGHRDQGEECDDGNTSDTDLCTSACHVRDELAGPIVAASDAGALAEGRTLGVGRHPVAIGDQGMAVVFVELNGGTPKLGVRLFGERGDTIGPAMNAPVPALFEADPVVAPLPNGRFAAAWTDPDDGDERGIRLARISTITTDPPVMLFANTHTDFTQHSPDLIWTGSQLVAAWGDDADLDTGPDIKLRLFDGELHPISGEQTLAGTDEAEGRVALAPFDGSWAAAWRSGDGETETLHVKTAAGTSWTVGPYLPGPDDDRPALVDLGGGQLMAVFTEGTDPADAGVPSVFRLRAAVLEGTTGGEVSSVSLPGGNDPIPNGVTISQTHPAAAVAGGKLYVAWRSYLHPADPDADELWVKEVTLPLPSSGSPTFLEYSLPRSASHRSGDQRRPALASGLLRPKPPGGMPIPAVLAAWDDYGQNLDSQQGKQDVVVELFAAPILRLASGEGQP